jgi:probable rRNA maturation factor
MDDDPHLRSAWPRILISNRQDRPVDVEGLRELAGDTLRGEGIERAELSVSFVDAAEMTELHERFMNEPGPTDVLSFPMNGADEAEGPEGVRLLGDVIVAPTEAERNEPEAPDSELRLLVVHGILHLLGYDHEENGARTRMWELQERYSGVRAP